MPHKHTRGSKAADPSQYDLPPSSIARPLPVAKSASTDPNPKNKKKRKAGKQPYDDTPREFARLLNYHKNGLRSQGPDEGEQRTAKKRKLGEADSISATKEKLTILPGERLSAFSARVNQALPVAGLARKQKQIQKMGLGKGLKERQTKTEKRMQRMQAEWRVQDAKRKEKEQEARELAEEQEAEHWGGLGGVGEQEGGPRSSKRKRRMGGAQRDYGDDDDPWATLKQARGQPRALNDYAQAPPKLRPVQEKLKIRNGATVQVSDVPNAAGSLRRREELGNTRRDIIESYRRLMQEKRGQT